MLLRRIVIITSLWILIPAAVLGLVAALALISIAHDSKKYRVEEPPEPYPGLGRPLPSRDDGR